MQAQTDHFSYYAATGGMSPDGKAGQDDAGRNGPPGDAGTGGTITEPGSCPSMPTTPPAGTTMMEGSLAHDVVPAGIPFSAKGGTAIASNVAMTNFGMTTYRSTFALQFTDYANACGYALASGARAEAGGRGARQASRIVSVVLRPMMEGSTPWMPQVTTYTGMPSPGGVMIDATFSDVDNRCGPASMSHLDDMTMQVTFTASDATHVAGTFDLGTTQNGDTLTGTFDFPLCPVPEMPTMNCCLP